MLVQHTGETPVFTAGPLDVVLVLKDVNTGRFHMAFFVKSPMPGPFAPYGELTIVRLKSKMHHTEGAETFEEALGHMDKFLAQNVLVDPLNIYREAAIEWDGQLGIICIVNNWRRTDNEQAFDPTKMTMNLGPALATT